MRKKQTVPGLLSSFSGVLGSQQSLCQLVGAGGLLHAAADAADALDDGVHIHTLDEGGDAHCI